MHRSSEEAVVGITSTSANDFRTTIFFSLFPPPTDEAPFVLLHEAALPVA